jgi:hypothetical protein
MCTESCNVSWGPVVHSGSRSLRMCLLSTLPRKGSQINADWRWKDPEAAVLSACSSLVAVVIDDGSRVVQFSHFSVEEFLTSDRLANSTEEVSRFHIPIEPCHAILARACLGVLLHLDDCTDQASIKEKIPLLQYAAEYWYQHAAFGKVESHIQGAMDRFFDLDKPHFSAWVRNTRPIRTFDGFRL